MNFTTKSTIDKWLPKKRPHADLNQSAGPSTLQNEISSESLVINEQPKKKTKNWQMNLKVKEKI